MKKKPTTARIPYALTPSLDVAARAAGPRRAVLVRPTKIPTLIIIDRPRGMR